MGVQPGDSITLIVNGEPLAVRVIGLLRPADKLSQQALDNLLLTDIATAQEIAGLPERITRIDLILDADDDLSAIRAILRQMQPLFRCKIAAAH